jgi:hypothetical protein
MQQIFSCDCIFFEATPVPTILDMATILGMAGMIPASVFIITILFSTTCNRRGGGLAQLIVFELLMRSFLFN